MQFYYSVLVFTAMCIRREQEKCLDGIIDDPESVRSEQNHDSVVHHCDAQIARAWILGQMRVVPP